MSKKEKTKTQQTVVSTPNNPQWVEDSTRGLQTRINGLLDTDPQSLVPGASALQQQAYSAAGGLLGGASGSPAPASPSANDWRTGNTAAQQAAAGLLNSRVTPATAQTAQARTSTAAADPRVTAERATSRGLLDVDLQAYQNPWEDAVVNSSLQNFDETSGMQRAALAAQQARGQKFSGSGAAIAQSLFERGNTRDRTGVESNLRSQGFDRATGLATSDLDRESATSQFNAKLGTDAALSEAGRFDEASQFNARQRNETSQFNAGEGNEMGRFNAGEINNMSVSDRDAQIRAAGLLGELSAAGSSDSRADLGLLSDMGDKQREIERERLGANPELLKLVSALNSNQPYNLYKGETSNSNGTSVTKTSDPMGQLSGLLAGAGAMATGLGGMGVTMSDKRLKEDVETEGKDASGRRLVSYRYKGEPKGVRRMGHIAQEVRKTDPHAVRKVGDYMAIDYGLLGNV